MVDIYSQQGVPNEGRWRPVEECRREIWPLQRRARFPVWQRSRVARGVGTGGSGRRASADELMRAIYRGAVDEGFCH